MKVVNCQIAFSFVEFFEVDAKAISEITLYARLFDIFFIKKSMFKQSLKNSPYDLCSLLVALLDLYFI